MNTALFHDETVGRSVDCLDKLHHLLTLDHLYPGYRADLEDALAEAARILDAVDKRSVADPVDGCTRSDGAAFCELCEPCRRRERTRPTRCRARRLTEPTGQPLPPDPDRREPVHAGNPARRSSPIKPLA